MTDEIRVVFRPAYDIGPYQDMPILTLWVNGDMVWTVDAGEWACRVPCLPRWFPFNRRWVVRPSTVVRQREALRSLGKRMIEVATRKAGT